MKRAQAIFLILLGAMCMSFSGVVLRHIEAASAVQVLIYRCFALACILPIIAMIVRKQSLICFFQTLSRQDFVLGVFMMGALSFYVYSILNTSVASTLFILAAAPFLTALLGWLWINEKPKMITWLAMVLALAGVALMVLDGLGQGRLFGNLMALGAAACFALCLVYTRRSGQADMLGGTFLGGVMACGLNIVVTLVLAQSLVISPWDIGLSMGTGFFAIGLGMALIIWAASYLPAADVSVLALFESVMGPVWVYVFLNEQMSLVTFIGGAIVFVSILIQAWGARRPRNLRALAAQDI